MSLTKQLWLAIGLVMALAFGGSMLVSVLSARHYLQQQLQVKNIDNATSLALALSQLDKDPVTVELQVAAQFDAGHYRFIRLTDDWADRPMHMCVKPGAIPAPTRRLLQFLTEAAPGSA